MYIFGFQYYRAPTPHKEEWAKDLKKIAEDGFNTVKFWVQWRWSNPKKGVYYWDDLDELMDLAAENGLKVVLNFILDVVPAWVVKKYPDCLLVTNVGEKLGPTPIDCRQIGGTPGVCFYHKKTNKIRKEFVRRAVEHFKDKKALYSWDVWNEPELTVSLKRKPNMDQLVCYCPNCIKKFQEEMHSKYKTIDNLNRVWGRNYTSFNEVEPPRHVGTYTDLVDWRQFFIDTISRDVKWRVDLIRQYDDGQHDISCHTVMQPNFPVVSTGSDSFKIAEYCDTFGNSGSGEDFLSRQLLSCANGKPAINSEVHIECGATFIPVEEKTTQGIYAQTLRQAFQGIDGMMIWQYHPEILGFEAPAWGAVDRLGNDTHVYKTLRSVNKYVQDNVKAFENNRPAADVAVYMSTQDEILMFGGLGCTTGYNCMQYVNSVRGAFELLNCCNQNVGFINNERLKTEDLSKYKAIYFSNLCFLDEEMAQAIANYIENGGQAIFESFFGFINPDKGVYEKILPCAGLAELLGIRNVGIYSRKGMNNCYIDNQVENDIVFIYKGDKKYEGAIYRTEYDVEGGTVLATFEDGATAVFEKKIGKGRALVFNTLFSKPYEERRNNNFELLNEILELCPQERLQTKEFVLHSDDKTIVCYLNDSQQEKSFALDGDWKIVFGEESASIEDKSLVLQANSMVVLEKKINRF